MENLSLNKGDFFEQFLRYKLYASVRVIATEDIDVFGGYNDICDPTTIYTQARQYSQVFNLNTSVREDQERLTSFINNKTNWITENCLEILKIRDINKFTLGLNINPMDEGGVEKIALLLSLRNELLKANDSKDRARIKQTVYDNQNTVLKMIFDNKKELEK